MSKITRRRFLQLASIGAAGALTLKTMDASGMMGSGGGGGGGMGGSTTTIDPPPGAPFRDPAMLPNLSTTAGTVEVELEAKRSPVDVNGVTANLLTYNGQYPGPMIAAKKGDKLRVRFKNSLPELGLNMHGHDRSPTNLHTHGLHVSPSGNADNVMLMFRPGDSFTYEYDLSMQEAGTLNFYHPHIHGTVAEQYWGGMAGPLLIADANNLLDGYETHVLFIKDISLSGTDPSPYSSMMDYTNGKEGNTVMVNGLVNPVLSIRPGQVQRWRVLNASNARFYKLSLEGHSLQVIGTDGGLLDKPYTVSSIVLSPGERVDLLVKASTKTGKYRLLSLPYSRMGMSTGQQVTLLTASVGGAKASDSVPSSINPEAIRPVAAIAKTVRLVLSMGQGKGYINGISFENMETAYTTHSNIGTYEIWEVVNDSGMDHPFHQHVNPCQVLSIIGGDSGYASLYTTAPAWKDVVLIPKRGSAKLLIPVMDYVGMAMFHCHIVEHEDIGMMGMWMLMGGGMTM